MRKAKGALPSGSTGVVTPSIVSTAWAGAVPLAAAAQPIT